MKLTIELPGRVFDRLVRLAIDEYRHTPQQAAYIIERYLIERDTGAKSGESQEPGGVVSHEGETL